MRYYILVLFLMIFIQLSSTICSQTLSLGFRVEPGILFTEQRNESSISFTPYGLYFTTLFSPTNLVTLEVRPGLFLAGEEYSGIEIGAFIRFKMPTTKLFVLAGINNHSNGGSGHNSGGSYVKKILYKGVGIGYCNDPKLSVDLMYYFTSDKDFAYSIVYDSYGKYRRENRRMNGILKIGFSLAWDVL